MDFPDMILISTRIRPKDGSTDAGICLCTYLTYLDMDMSSTCAKSGDASHRQDPLPLNSAVIVRVWPRPYSVWEDNPEDPEAIDGTSASVRKATQNHLVNRQNYWELYRFMDVHPLQKMVLVQAHLVEKKNRDMF